MKQLPSEKYNVAWFKLAEFVSRGEKERALGLYRLLAHSLQDQALVFQLEGDLLLSFNDENAFDRYRTAALLYQQDARTIEAAAVYEHLLTLLPETQEISLVLIQLYAALGIHSRLLVHLTTVIHCLLLDKNFDRVTALLDEYEKIIGLIPLTKLYQELTFILIKEQMSEQYVLPYLLKTVQALFKSNDPQHLQIFLSSLESLHYPYYRRACHYLEHGTL